MGIKQELTDLLVRLPAVDGPEERRALVAFTGPAELGIYLDWQGSRVVFAERLLAELSRRGKAALAAFVAALPKTPQVEYSQEHRKASQDLASRISGLDEESFRAEFPLPAPSGEGAPRPADPAMLAAALVNEILAPYYKLDAEELRREAGKSGLALAEGTERQLEPVAGALMSHFRENPKEPACQKELLAALRDSLTADPALAAQLAAALSSAAGLPGDGGLRSLVRVSQQASPVSGDLASIIVEPEVVNQIRYKIDTGGGSYVDNRSDDDTTNYYFGSTPVLIVAVLLVGALAVVGIFALDGSRGGKEGLAAQATACPVHIDSELEKVWSNVHLGCPEAHSKIVWSAWQPFEYGYMLWSWHGLNDQESFYYVLRWQDHTDSGAGTWQRWSCIGQCPALPEDRPTPPPDLREPTSGFGHVFFAKVLEDGRSPIGWAREDQKGFCARIQKFERGFIVASTGDVRCLGDDGNEGALDLNFILTMNYSVADEERGRFRKESP